MKKIIVFALVVALCATALCSCDIINGMMNKENPVTDVAIMYSMSNPTKVVATTVQDFGSFELNSNYELVTGYVDNSLASVYTVTTEELRTIEEGGNTEEVKDMIKTTTKKTEAIEGYGSRTNGGDWDAEGEVWTIGRGRMALNLKEELLENVTYADHTLKFTVSKDNAATVLGKEYAKHLAGSVEVTIVDDGAVVTSVELHYFLAGDGANLVDSEMTIKVVYTYDLERITIV